MDADARRQRGTPAPAAACAPLPGADAGFRAQAPRRWTDADGEHIDVRGLPPPEPLVAILSRVAELAGQGGLIVHHDRDPVLLYPELAELGWQAEALDAPPGEIRLKLSPGAGP